MLGDRGTNSKTDGVVCCVVSGLVDLDESEMTGCG